MTDQKPLVLAAKRAGVGRIIPSDFGPHAPRGVMPMHDMVGFPKSQEYFHANVSVETRHSGFYQTTCLAVYVHRSRLVASASVPIPACHASQHAHAQDLHR
ncbi:hypothetical protein BDZ89DRAFT_307817 [Hymenopellis radicata]|nr:hypothetical protein BDZ89DRAFT_307817 [Hymenopellis radicata]